MNQFVVGFGGTPIVTQLSSQNTFVLRICISVDVAGIPATFCTTAFPESSPTAISVLALGWADHVPLLKRDKSPNYHTLATNAANAPRTTFARSAMCPIHVFEKTVSNLFYTKAV